MSGTRDLWLLAALLVSRDGEQAAALARTKASDRLELGDPDGAWVWRQVAGYADQWLQLPHRGPAH